MFAVKHGRSGLEAQGGRVSSRFTAVGPVVSAGSGSVALSLRGAGPAVPRAARNRVVYEHRNGITEWYTNGPVGLEQGFILRRAPPGVPAGRRLELALGLSGSLAPSLRGGEVSFGDPDRPALIYGALSVSDAAGRTLPAGLHLRKHELVIAVDTAGARYPIRIDPLIQQGTKLAPGGVFGDTHGFFGVTVAMSADGSTAIVGAPADENSAGAAWVYVRSGSAWAQQGPPLSPFDELGNGQFGSDVAISGDGNTVLVGGPSDGAAMNFSFPGAAWVFTRSGSVWTQDGTKLLPSDENNTVRGGSFGTSVALSTDGLSAVIGGIQDNGGRGAAWAFSSTGNGWAQQGSKLVAPDGATSSSFGSAAALSPNGNTALIGAATDNNGAGAAWVFIRSGGTWSTNAAKLTGSDEVGNAQLGEAVALSADGTTALVGGRDDARCSFCSIGPGAAWVFVLSDGVWAQQGPKLTPSDENNSGGGGQFGSGVSLSADGNTALIGGLGDGPETQGGDPGAVWMFTRSGGTWSQQGSKFTPSDEDNTARGGSFGEAIALSPDGTEALIGGGTDTGGNGALWAFARSGTTWTQQGSKLIGAEPDSVGWKVALSADGNTALIGGPGEAYDFTPSSGVAWVYVRSGPTWTKQAGPLEPNGIDDGEGGSQFGAALALSADGNTALIGAPLNAGGDGAVWMYTRSGTTWTQGTSITQAAEDNSGGGAEFGFDIALSADASTAVITAPFDGAHFAGAAWVYTRSGASWSQQGSKLTPSDEVGNANFGGVFGGAVALSSDGNTALISGPFEGAGRGGAAWVFARSGATWGQQGPKLVPAGEDNSGGGAGFGEAVALSSDGNTAVIGGPFDTDQAKGAAWIFTRSGGSWQQHGRKLTPNDEDNSGPGGGFGESVALSSDGNTAMIGGPFDGSSSGGATWLYGRGNDRWRQLGSKLAPTDEDNAGGGGGFGFSVTLSQDAATALVGAPGDGGANAGAAWVFGAAQPAKPVGISAFPGSGSGLVLVTPTDGPVSSYTVTASPGGATATSATSPILVPGLTDGVAYSFTVTATNAAGTSAPSDASNLVTPGASLVPWQPTNIYAVAGPGDGQATISFTPAAGPPATQYSVIGVGVSGIVSSGTSSPITVSRLTDGTTYSFTVSPTNGAGTGILSAESNPVTPVHVVSLPGAPTNLTAQSFNGLATVLFTPPTSDGGGAITSYTVTASPGGAQATGTQSPISLHGLTAGASYTFTVTATNSAGTGPPSSPSNAVTIVPISGGGGGAGGGGAPPNLNVMINPSLNSGNLQLKILIGNKGGVAFNTVLTVTTSGLSSVGSVTLWGLGAGCSTSGSTTTCQFVSLPAGDPVSVAIVGGTLSGGAASATASLSQTNPSDTDTSDDAATWSYSLPSSTPPTSTRSSPSTKTTPSTKAETAPKRTVDLIVTLNKHGKVALSPKGTPVRAATAVKKNAPPPQTAEFVYPIHSTLTASAIVDRGYEFVRWTGACNGTKPTCHLHNLTASKRIGFITKSKPKTSKSKT